MPFFTREVVFACATAGESLRSSGMEGVAGAARPHPQMSAPAVRPAVTQRAAGRAFPLRSNNLGGGYVHSASPIGRGRTNPRAGRIVVLFSSISIKIWMNCRQTVQTFNTQASFAPCTGPLGLFVRFPRGVGPLRLSRLSVASRSSSLCNSRVVPAPRHSLAPHPSLHPHRPIRPLAWFLSVRDAPPCLRAIIAHRNAPHAKGGRHAVVRHPA